MAILREKDIKVIKEMFDNEMENEVKVIFFGTKDETKCQYCDITKQVLEELASVDSRIILSIKDFDEDKEDVGKYSIEMVPATVILTKDGKDLGVRFYGIPSGHEFPTLLQTIITFSKGAKPNLSQDSIEKLSEIKEPLKISVFITPTCPYCPRAVSMAHNIALANENIVSEMIEANEFFELSENFGVSSVPHIVINRDPNKFFIGAYPEKEFVEQVLRLVKR
ncbi:MAG TPA: glutaredoxin [Thermotoga sp.]|nr:glutaredoxin [Thermotoga sp.]